MKNKDGRIGKIVAICWTVVVALTICITLIVILPDWNKGSASSRQRSAGNKESSTEETSIDETGGDSTESTSAAAEDTTAAIEETTAATTEMTTQATTEAQVQSGDSDFVIPGSDTRYLTESDLYGLTAEQLRLARNEIYARHGRKFKDEELQSYFNSKSWYTGTIEPDNFTESMLNDYEIANTELIKNREDELN